MSSQANQLFLSAEYKLLLIHIVNFITITNMCILQQYRAENFENISGHGCLVFTLYFEKFVKIFILDF